MSRIYRLLPLTLAFVLMAGPSLAQERDTTLPRLSPNAATAFQLGVTNIEVTYGAPSVRDRTIFGELVPYDDVWRAGANEATTVTFSTDVIVEGHPVEAGSYMLAAIPRSETWTLVLNAQPGQWGTYQYDAAQDILRADVMARPAPQRETMSFSFDNLDDRGELHAVDLVLHWDEVMVPIRIETDTDRHVVAHAAAAMDDGNWRSSLAFARYALQTGRHVDEAAAWADAAVRGEESYGTLAVAARLHAAAGNYAAALDAGERALALVPTMERPPADAEGLRTEVDEWRQLD